MDSRKRAQRLASKIKTEKELPIFSEAQISTFNSDYVDSLDEALAVLDEDNKLITSESGVSSKSV